MNTRFAILKIGVLSASVKWFDAFLSGRRCEMHRINLKKHGISVEFLRNIGSPFQTSTRYNILGDPGADSGGEGKSKRAEK